jgi:hypothetical protein
LVTDLFIDGASEITVQTGIVRLNLVALSATEKDAEGRPVREVRHRLLMTPQAAAEVHAHLETALRRLEQLGVVSKKQAA